MSRKVLGWIKRRFDTFDLLLDYFRAARLQFLDVIWGVGVGATVPFLVWGVYSLFKTPPPIVNWLAIVAAVFLAGYYVWRADHMRLQRKIDITKLSLNEWTIAQGQVNAGRRARSYDFTVTNSSGGITVDGISVQLKQLVPEVEQLNFLPVHLHIRHDNPMRAEDQVRSFALNPGEPRRVDLVSAFEADSNFSVVHVVHGANCNVPFNVEDYRLQVMITAKDMPPSFKWFKVWRDSTGLLRCEMENENTGTNI